jgi:meso-butanediol dehydrogenase / (S,S)-butanediol dehydrogenase / diacetyl reductase
MNFVEEKINMSERSAFVSGSARGIGRAIALRLARDGLNVAVNDIKSNLSALEATAEEIRALGKPVIKIQRTRLTLRKGVKASVAVGDVSKRDEITTAFDTAVKDLGGLHVSSRSIFLSRKLSSLIISLQILVANAGICKIKPFVDVTTEEWEAEMAVNMTGESTPEN